MRKVAVGTLVLLFVGSACGGGEAVLRGVVRDEPLEVASLVVPEVVVVGDEVVVSPFAFQPPEGELLVVYFGFTFCPDVCPTTLADVRAATRRLDPGDAARVSLAMVTVDPGRDTPELLSRYVASFSDRAHALRTDDPALLEQAEDAFLASSRVLEDDAGAVTVEHSAMTYVVDDRGHVVVEWPFGFSIDNMQHDLELLLARN